MSFMACRPPPACGAGAIAAPRGREPVLRQAQDERDPTLSTGRGMPRPYGGRGDTSHAILVYLVMRSDVSVTQLVCPCANCHGSARLWEQAATNLLQVTGDPRDFIHSSLLFSEDSYVSTHLLSLCSAGLVTGSLGRSIDRARLTGAGHSSKEGSREVL